MIKFSMDWFRSKIKEKLKAAAREEIENLLVEALSDVQDEVKEEIKEELETTKIVTTPASSSMVTVSAPPSVGAFSPPTSPYKNLICINDNVTVVFSDGETYFTTINGDSEETLKDIREATSKEEIISILTSPIKIPNIVKEGEDSVDISKCAKILLETGEFELRNNSIYLKEISNRSIPAILIEKFAEVVEANGKNDLNECEAFSSLKKFWMKCCLNPNARSAEDLYGFLKKHKFDIDRHGNFYAYRRVVSKHGNTDKELVEFVSNIYTKIKAVWKKKPSDYYVQKTEDGYDFSKVKDGYTIGNLAIMYENLSAYQTIGYTSAHTGRENYQVGTVISMPRNNTDDDNMNSCSRGSK